MARARHHGLNADPNPFAGPLEGGPPSQAQEWPGSDQRPHRPVSISVLVAALVFQGVSGLAGGIGLVVDPSGVSLGIPREWLRGSPFGDYLVPGLVLLTLLGLAPLVVAHGCWRSRTGSRIAALLIGLGLVTWIGVQILIIGYHRYPPLQLVYGALGVAIIVLAIQPGARRWLGERR